MHLSVHLFVTLLLLRCDHIDPQVIILLPSFIHLSLNEF